jgi:hypothetical protein
MNKRTNIIISIASALIFGGLGIYMLATRDPDDLGKKDPFDYIDYYRIQTEIDSINEQIKAGSKSELTFPKLMKFLMDYYEVHNNSDYSPARVKVLEENLLDLMLNILEAPPYGNTHVNELVSGELQDMFAFLEQQQLSTVLPRLHALASRDELDENLKATINECIVIYVRRFTLE